MRERLEAVEARYEELPGSCPAPRWPPTLPGFGTWERAAPRARGGGERLPAVPEGAERCGGGPGPGQGRAGRRDPRVLPPGGGRAAAEARELEGRLEILLLPKDPNDEKNVIVEIRAGAGGQEAALFAADLLGMYRRYAEARSWKTEILSSSLRTSGDSKRSWWGSRGRGVLAAEARVRRAPGAADPGDRVRRAHPHLDRHGGRPARGGGGRGGHTRGGRGRPGVPVLGAGRPVGEHDGLGGSPYPQAHRDRHQRPGGALPAAEQGEAYRYLGPGCCSWSRSGSTRRSRGPASTGGHGGAGREDPNLQFPAEPGHRPSHRAHVAPVAGDPGRPARRVRRRLAGQGALEQLAAQT